MEVVSVILSVLSLFGTSFVYVMHNRKLKQQEEELNKLHLNEIEREIECRKMAIVRMDTLYKGNGSGVLVLYNNGQAEARNISWHFKEDVLYGNLRKGNYERLVPGQKVKFEYFLTFSNQKTTQVSITWADDFKKDNSLTMTLYVLNNAN